MKQNIIAILILTFCISYNVLSSKETNTSKILEPINYYSYPITKIVDGDTIEIEVDFLPIELGKYIKLRINSIDSPELHGQCLDEVDKAKKAKKFLNDLIKSGRDVKIVLNGRDKYFRLLGDVIVDGKPVSVTMVETNHAVLYSGATKQSWCNTK